MLAWVRRARRARHLRRARRARPHPLCPRAVRRACPAHCARGVVWRPAGKKKGKNKKKGVPTAAADSAKAVKLKLSFEDLALWKKLDIEAPKEMSEMPTIMQALLDKKEWLKTAPYAAAAALCHPTPPPPPATPLRH